VVSLAMTDTFKERQHYHFILDAVRVALRSDDAIDNLRFLQTTLNRDKGQVHKNWFTQGRLNGYSLESSTLHLLSEKQMSKMMPLISQAFPVVISAIQQARVKDNHVRSWHPLIARLESIQDDMGVAREDE
jgi:hypothetical protein